MYEKHEKRCEGAVLLLARIGQTTKRCFLIRFNFTHWYSTSMFSRSIAWLQYDMFDGVSIALNGLTSMPVVNTGPITRQDSGANGSSRAGLVVIWMQGPTKVGLKLRCCAKAKWGQK